MSQDCLKPSNAEQKALANGIKWVNRTPYLAAGVLFVLIASYATAFINNGWSKSPEAWGQLGDYIGGVLNPLVAGFALLALVVSVRLQKTELADTRKELENSRMAMEEQAKTAEQQRREQRFFDFLNIYRATLDSIEFEIASASGAATAFKGKRAFKHLTSSKSRTNPLSRIISLFATTNRNDQLIACVLITVASEWDEYSPVLDHYFRTVFTLLREAEMTLKDDQWRYMKLFRAQFSRDEVNLLAMNLLYDEEGKKMRPLVIRYGMLKHMPDNPLREIAYCELDPLSFGRKWTASHITASKCETAHAD